MIVLTRRFPNGEESHCDARCHFSHHKKCTCICKGLLHGKGLSWAKLNAVKASMYLNIQADDIVGYWPASQLIPDRGGR